MNPYSPPDEDAPAHRVVWQEFGKRPRRPILAFATVFFITAFMAGPWLHWAPVVTITCILTLSILAAWSEFKGR